jgi:hypothetical protein
MSLIYLSLLIVFFAARLAQLLKCHMFQWDHVDYHKRIYNNPTIHLYRLRSKLKMLIWYEQSIGNHNGYWAT